MKILEYSECFNDEIVKLIIDIQQNEFGLAISVEDQPDLTGIYSYYIGSGGNFWVCVLDGMVVGTVALVNIGDNDFALRKMFVKRKFRGSELNIGGRLLKNAEVWAQSRGAVGLYLGTTEKFLAAHKFYMKNGYSRVAINDLPSAFPVMSVDKIFFRKAF